MQIAPTNPVLQALAGAEAATTRVKPEAATHTDTVRAVDEPRRTDAKRDTENPPKEEPKADNPARRGRFLDIRA
jgi:hypothetical protein